jgi:hypothetical protein
MTLYQLQNLLRVKGVGAVIVAYFKLQSLLWPGGTEKIHEKQQTG